MMVATVGNIKNLEYLYDGRSTGRTGEHRVHMLDDTCLIDSRFATSVAVEHKADGLV